MPFQEIIFNTHQMSPDIWTLSTLISTTFLTSVWSWNTTSKWGFMSTEDQSVRQNFSRVAIGWMIIGCGIAEFWTAHFMNK